MFILDTPPDTSTYMVAGYVIFFILIILYLTSLFIRTRNLNQELTILESMKVQSHSENESLVAIKPPHSTGRDLKRKTAKAKVGRSNRVKKKVIKKK